MKFLRAQCGARYPMNDDDMSVFAGNIRKDGAIRMCVYSSGSKLTAPKHPDGKPAACQLMGCDKPRGTARKAGVKGPFRIFQCGPNGENKTDEKGKPLMGYAMTCHFEIIEEPESKREVVQ